jgi:hypothetical protein
LGGKQHKDRQSPSTTKDHRQPSGERQDGRPTVYSVRIEQPPDQDKWRAEQREYWGRQIRSAIVLNWVTGVAAMAGLFGLLVLWGTMQATQDSATAAKISSDLIRESRRGWILFSESRGPQLPLVPDKQPLIDLGFKNFGSGIAKYLTTYVGVAIQPECTPFWEVLHMFPSFLKEEAVVVPPGKTLWVTPDLGLTLNVDQIKGLSPPTPTNKFCIFGYTSYFDEFGVKHGTMFCLWYDLTLPPNALSYCSTDNDAW